MTIMGDFPNITTKLWSQPIILEAGLTLCTSQCHAYQKPGHGMFCILWRNR